MQIIICINTIKNMSTIKAGNISKGLYLSFKNQPHQVTKTQFVSPGKGSAFMKASLRNIKTDKSIDFTFKSTETVEVLDITSRKLQFSYDDGTDYVFMDPNTYEQFPVDKKIVADKINYLSTQEDTYILTLNDQALAISLPPKVRLKVTQAEEAIAGNRVNAGKKPVTMETGLVVQAPLFVKKNDTLIIDTSTGEYVSRA